MKTSKKQFFNLLHKAISPSSSAKKRRRKRADAYIGKRSRQGSSEGISRKRSDMKNGGSS